MKRSSRLVVLAAALSVAPASASPLFELVGGATGTGGFNARVTGAGAPSTYFNPALLGFAPNEFTVGALVLSDQIGMTLDGRPGGDVPLVVGDRTALDPGTHAPIPNDTVPTDWLERGCTRATCGPDASFAPRPRQSAGTSGRTRAYTTIGLVSRILDPWLTLGIHAIVPVANFTEVGSFYSDEREQFFSNSVHPELYSDRLTATSLAFGAASRLSKRLSIGVSFTLQLTNTAKSSTYVRDPVDYRKLLLDNGVTVTTSVSPHFGVVFVPIDRLRTSFTVHTPQKFVVKTGITAALPDGSQSRTTLEEVHDFVPLILAAGADFDLNPGDRHAVSVAWTVAYEAWSAYVDRHGETPGDAGPGFAFKDIVTASAGPRYTTGSLRAFLDFTVHPTPVPPQTGRTNYADNDRVGAALGADYEVLVGTYRLRFGVGGQAQRLLRRYQKKDDALVRDELPDGALDQNLAPLPGTRGLQTNNPGWPGFASDGWILATNLHATLLY